MNKTIEFSYLIIILSFFLVGCESNFKIISIKDDFISNNGTSIGLIWVKGSLDMKNTAQNYVLGKPKLTDLLINKLLSVKLSDALEKVNLQDKINEHYFKVFKLAFLDNKFNVKIKSNAYCWNKFKDRNNKVLCKKSLKLLSREGYKMKIMKIPEYSGVSIPARNYDYRPIIKEMNVDYLSVIVLFQHGTGRSYFSSIPTSHPKGITSLVSYMIDGKNGEVIGQNLSYVLVTSQGEWDEPPDYNNLMKASDLSFEQAMDKVFIDVFKQAP